MKRITLLTLTLYLFTAFVCQSQTIQGTLKQGSVSNSVMVALTPNQTFSGSFTNLQFTIQIPNTVVPQPVVTIRSNPLAVNMPSINYQTTVTNEGGFYNYLYGGVALGTPSFNFVSGVEFNALELEFSGTSPSSDVRLAQLPNGGSNFQQNFYIEVGGIDRTNTTAMFYGAGAINNGGYDVYSYVTIGSLVPVNWLDFTAIRQNNDALLNWSVASEVNNHHYEIERSTNGVSFTPVNLVPSSNPNGGRHDYQYVDANIRSLNSDIIYYRIKQVDLDGKFTYSIVKHVKFTKGDISIYPNPAKDGFQVLIPYLTTSDRNIQMKLENALGQVIETRVLNATQAANYYFRFSGAKVSSGNYTLRIYKDTELLETKKIIVAR